MQEGEDVRDYVSRFFDAVDKLEEMDVNVNQDLLTILLLYSLPETYKNFRCHLNERNLKRVMKDGGIVGAEIEAGVSLPTCEICLKGKFAKAHFPKKSMRNTELLAIIHMDVCGPMRVESTVGAKYIATITDDYSRWCEIRFLKKKSDLLPAFKDYKALVEN